jgi:hypothetical protein
MADIDLTKLRVSSIRFSRNMPPSSGTVAKGFLPVRHGSASLFIEDLAGHCDQPPDRRRGQSNRASSQACRSSRGSTAYSRCITMSRGRSVELARPFLREMEKTEDRPHQARGSHFANRSGIWMTARRSSSIVRAARPHDRRGSVAVHARGDSQQPMPRSPPTRQRRPRRIKVLEIVSPSGRSGACLPRRRRSRHRRSVAGIAEASRFVQLSGRSK